LQQTVLKPLLNRIAGTGWGHARTFAVLSISLGFAAFLAVSAILIAEERREALAGAKREVENLVRVVEESEPQQVDISGQYEP